MKPGYYRAKRYNTRKWKVWNHTQCIECHVYARNKKEAIEMAIARSSLFAHRDTDAKEVNTLDVHS